MIEIAYYNVAVQFGLVGPYCISTIVGHSIPDSVYTMIPQSSTLTITPWGHPSVYTCILDIIYQIYDL